MICVMIMINIILRILQVISLILTTIFCFFYGFNSILDIPKCIMSWIILSSFLIYVILMSIILLMKLKKCDFADDTILNFYPTGIFLVNILVMKFMNFDLINILKENWKEVLLFVLLFYTILIIVRVLELIDYYIKLQKIIKIEIKKYYTKMLRALKELGEKNEKKTFK